MTQERLTRPKDPLWEVTKKVTLASVLMPSLGTALAYIAYADDLATSGWPWRIGAIVTLLCVLGPLVVTLAARRSRLLWAYGLVAIIPMVGMYFFFGVVFNFFYFLFAPMPALLRWTGLSGGVALTFYWLVMSWQTVSRTIAHTTFVTRAFMESPACFEYQPQSAMLLFEKLNKERLPFPKIYLYIVMGIGPFALIFERLVSASFGTNGVLFFLAVLGMPLSLWIAGVLVRVYLVMIRLPLRLQREHHKPVLVDSQ